MSKVIAAKMLREQKLKKEMKAASALMIREDELFSSDDDDEEEQQPIILTPEAIKEEMVKVETPKEQLLILERLESLRTRLQ